MHVFIKGIEIQIDEEDLHFLNEHKWWANGCGYLTTQISKPGGGRRSIGLHRMIMGDPENRLVVDHINRDKSDNRKCNLRVCSYSDNNFNRPVFLKPHKGVSFRKGKWQVVIKINGKPKWFGHYDTMEGALVIAKEQLSARDAA